ncbi:helix-turn-helix domain-containing protein [Natronobacterium gregoryi]|nr:helix-turn-helix domain-containing protein [Natronobacterium gregoryi]AFZ71865.1 putative DNA binding protein [Natronobacterium gregoryi SP2]PLK19381.1 bacterio-opsin activator [Natronobacterium gregoryi SP2]SFJ50683.1 HTH DNA binding domain-containing protein [Natronobacterium gregoryi]
MTGLENADRLRITTEVSDIDSVQEVLTHLAELEATVDPQGMAVVDPSDDHVAEVDVGSLTTKQLRALELAYTRGYYEQPRETGLEELSAELDISKSAVSQRLRAAESKLVVAVLQAIRPWLVQSEVA